MSRRASANSNWPSRLSSGQLLFLVIGLSGLVNHVSCQEFEDLNQQQKQSQGRRIANSDANLQFASQQQFSNSRQFGGPQQQQQTFAQSAPVASQTQNAIGQQQFPVASNANQRQSSAQQAALAQTAPFQRTNGIPSRFANSVQQQQLSSSGSPGPQFASSQPQAVVAAPQATPVQPDPDQIMKAALARTSKLEAEARQDTAPPGAAQTQAASRTTTSSASTALQSRQGAQYQSATAAAPVTETQSDDDDSNGPNSQASTTTASAHETVYSDQRFASLFARRKTLNKSKFTPTETAKAKPTLPSFIKSLPDPKQFTASDGEAPASPAPRPLASASSANLVQARPNRLNSGSAQLALATANSKNTPQKKPSATGVITSNSANSANNKKANALNGKPGIQNSKLSTNSKDPKSGALAAAAVTTNKPISNNPFSRNNANSNDPANVIAMARKRLLANNALESGKLKLQQQQQKAVAAAN